MSAAAQMSLGCKKTWLTIGCALVLSALGGCAIAPKPDQVDADTQVAAPIESSVVIAEPLLPPMPAADKINVAPIPDLWERFQLGRHWRRCELTPGMEHWIKRYASKPERFASTLEPLIPLMEYVLTRVEALELPSEIMLIPIVESYYRPDARGPGGALGLWQLMPDTGRLFGLTGKGNADQRLDVQASTGAALRLLQINADAFSHNPKLMFAAYNAGAYRLRKALRGRDHASMNSLEGLGLSRTTRDYIDKIKALACLIGEPERFALSLPAWSESARLVEFRTPYPVDPNELSARASVAVADAKRWNQTAFSRNATDAARPFLLPATTSAAAQRALQDGQLSKASPKPAPISTSTVASRVYKVASGDSLWTISRRYRVGLADLMRWNGLNKRSVLRIGQRLNLQSK